MVQSLRIEMILRGLKEFIKSFLSSSRVSIMTIYTTTLTSNWRRKFTSQSRLIFMIKSIIIGCKHLSKYFLFTHARTQIMTKFTTFCTFIINYLRRQVFIVRHRTSLFTIPRHPTIIHDSMKHNRIHGIEQTHK